MICHLKIVSGGQTGVDRAALDAALRFDVDCGGWCPAGRKAEDGKIPVRYPLTELTGAGYRKRTLCPYLYTQVGHSGRDCRNPGYKDVLSLPSQALDTRFPAGMTIFVYNEMPYAGWVL